MSPQQPNPGHIAGPLTNLPAAAPGLIDLNRRAVLASAALVDRVTAADLVRPTPCAGWTLADLLAHMTVQHHGFAAAVRGHGADPASWAAPPNTPADPVTGYAEAAAVVLAAFAEDGAADRPFALPEILPGVTFPGRQAIGFHLVDYVVHAWDVARALGLPCSLDDDVVAAALMVAINVPDGPNRRAPGAAFQPSAPVPAGAVPLDQIVALLGRPPAWPAPDPA